MNEARKRLNYFRCIYWGSRRMSKLLVAIFIVLISVVCLSAQQVISLEGVSLTETGRKAFAELENENLFALGGTGYGAEISKGEKALDILLSERQAEEAFYRLAISNSGAGGLYG